MKLSHSLLLLCLSLARHMLYSSSLGDAIVVAALASSYCYSLYLESKKEEPINDAIKSELENLRTAVSSLKIAKSLSR